MTGAVWLLRRKGQEFVPTPYTVEGNITSSNPCDELHLYIHWSSSDFVSFLYTIVHTNCEKTFSNEWCASTDTQPRCRVEFIASVARIHVR
jgi:hypothetical protein